MDVTKIAETLVKNGWSTEDQYVYTHPNYDGELTLDENEWRLVDLDGTTSLDDDSDLLIERLTDRGLLPA